MKLVWSISGDHLDIDICHVEMIAYWLNALNAEQKNSFKLMSSTIDLDSTNQLNNYIKEINKTIEKISITEFKQFEDQDFTDQSILNRLHETWVKAHSKYPKLIQFILAAKKLAPWNNINHLIHSIEFLKSKPHISYTNTDVFEWQIKNIFGPSLLTHDSYQLELHFQNLGRSTYEKWINFDDNIHDTDTNNFTHIGGQVNINLMRFIEGTPPREYIQWCSDNKVIAHGHRLPIGNFTGYNNNISEIRKLIFKNLSYENNRIFFTL